MSQSERAAQIARKLVQNQLPVRWAHTQRVAAQARSLRPILGDDADLLEAAAWLHDIGYSADLAVTGFHPLDGARYLRHIQGADNLVCGLVAHHTRAIVEARERGLAAELAGEFSRPRPDLDEALIFCDMTGGPDGIATTVDARLAEIFSRYAPDHPVSHAVRRAAVNQLCHDEDRDQFCFLHGYLCALTAAHNANLASQAATARRDASACRKCVMQCHDGRHDSRASR